MFTFKDGGQIALDWVDEIPSQNSNDQKPLLFITPGIGAGSDVGYLLNTCEYAKSHGFRIVIINYRVCSNIPLTSPKFFSSMSAYDLREPVDYIFNKHCIDQQTKNRTRQVFYLGISFSGCILSHFLAQEGENSIFTAAATCSSAMRTKEAVTGMKANLFGMYQTYYSLALKKILVRASPALQEHHLTHHNLNLEEELMKCKTVDDGNSIIARLVGLKSLDTYLSLSGQSNAIPYIKTPTIIYKKAFTVVLQANN
eukprot:403356453